MQRQTRVIELPLSPSAPRPYFAEIPYYLWGEVNYDSDGDCQCPTDHEWHNLEVRHRETREWVTIEESSGVARIKGHAENVARVAYFLEQRCGIAGTDEQADTTLGEWDHAQAQARTERIRREFPRSELTLFDNHLFWGSWKWVGWFATEFTWVGRWIMNSVLTADTRAVCLCVDWLKQGTVDDRQSQALRGALQHLTKLDFMTDEEWVSWYYRGFSGQAGQTLYPEPDVKRWLNDLRQ